MATAAIMDDNKLVDDMSEAIAHYIETRLHPEAPADFKAMVAEVLTDGIEMGAAWADMTSGRDRNLILTPH